MNKIIAVTSAIALSATAAKAQRTTPVTVQNTAANPVAVEQTIEKTPVICREQILSDGRRAQASSCTKVGERISFGAVPAGYYLVITDIYVRSNGLLSVSGKTYAISVGLDDGGAFPASPRIRLDGDPSQTQLFQFKAPRLVYSAGQRPSMAHVDPRTSQASVNAGLSGFLIKEKDISKAF